jgi:hypothetical protein
LRDRLGGLDKHDVGGAPHALEFAVEGDAADAIDPGDASAPNKAKHEFLFPMRMKVCPIIARPPLPCGKATQP